MPDIIRRDQVFTGKKLASLPRTQFSGLDFDNIIADITELVTENPEYNKNWDDFLSSNAGRLMVEFFAYIADQLSTRMDWMVNENFIGTATQKKSVIRLLKLIGYNLDLPKAAKVDVNIVFDRPVGTVDFSGTGTGENLDLFSLSAVGLDGSERKNFEAISFNEEIQKYNYVESTIKLETGSSESNSNLQHTVSFYEGRTFVFEIDVTTNNNFAFQLPQFPVLQNSARVYLINQAQDEQEELEQVLSFLDPRAQRETDQAGELIKIPYILNVLDQNIVEVEFGPTSLLSSESRRPVVGNKIRVYYRVGGGEDGNITKRSINITRRLEFNGISTNVSFLNNFQGFGGEEGEDAAFASVVGPLQIKTVNKAVTEEDYDILLLGNTNIIKSKSYGNNNLPAQFFQRYNVFMKPLEVWNYSILNKPGWTEIPPSRYDDFQWIQLRLENRFNQKLSFTEGKFNDSYVFFASQIQKNIDGTDSFFTIDNSDGNDNDDGDDDGDDDETLIIPKNYILINTNQKFKNSLSENSKIKITSKELSENYFFLTKENNIFNKQVELQNKAELDFSKGIFYLKQEEKAYYVSSRNLEEGFGLNGNQVSPNTIEISFDNRESIVMNLEEATTNDLPKTLTPENISDYINKRFSEAESYNNSGENETIGSQKLGLNITNFDEVISLPRNKDYYFKVNGIEFSINTGKENLTYNELLKKIDRSFGVEFKGNISRNFDKITITDGLFRKNFINKGAVVLSETDESIIPLENLIIENYNWITNELTLNDTSKATRTNHTFRVRTFCTCKENNDIKIQNLSEEPFGVVLLQNSERDSSEDLFTAIGADLQEPINCRGVSGYHDLGIEGAITSTRGFQAFKITNDISNITGERRFDLLIDDDEYSKVEIIVNFDLPGEKNEEYIRTQILSQLEEQYVDYTEVEVPEIDTFGDLRIISTLKGSFSTIRISDSDSGGSLINALGGVEDSVDGIDSPLIEVSPGEYSFKINNHTYKINITGNETYEDLVNKLNNEVLDYFTAKIVYEENDIKEWERDIRIENNFSDRVYIQDINFFENIKIEKLNDRYSREQEDWEEFKEPVGGGDYSAVSGIFSTLTENDLNETYIYLRSPSIGRYNSIVSFHHVQTRSATLDIFGITTSNGQEEKNYGYRKLSVLVEQEDDNFGNIIYENGSLNFFGKDFEQIFVNHISNSVNQITLGRFNTDNFELSDPLYREPAFRLYNTVYDKSTEEIDYFNSNFLLKYTKEKTDEVSIFSIENDWPQLKRATPAEISSVDIENVQNFIGENPNKFLIKINIDNIGDIEIDIYGDSQDIPEGYTLENMAKTINDTIQSDVNYTFGVYFGFDFAAVEENKIIIRSPISTSNSKIVFKKPSDESADISNEMFFINYDINGESEIITTGDYYIIENRQTISGNFSTGSDVIREISEEDFEKIQVGDKIYENIKQNLTLTRKCFVVSKNFNEKSIKISLPAFLTRNNESFDFSNNLMMLNKIEREESFVPDLDFYLHFVNDKRYVEGIFDGKEITTEGTSFKTPGYPLDSLDEDRLKSFMNDKKIVSIENVFKQTKFRTFDIKANIYYNKNFTRDDVRQRVEKSLRDFYSLRNRNYAEGVSRSKIMSIIHNNAGVEFVELEYLGFDATKPKTSVDNIITARFDEIIVLSENRSFSGRVIRGLIFNYLVDN